jgi:hypothetical protein
MDDHTRGQIYPCVLLPAEPKHVGSVILGNFDRELVPPRRRGLSSLQQRKSNPDAIDVLEKVSSFGAY